MAGGDRESAPSLAWRGAGMELGAPLRRTVGGQEAPRCDTRVPSQYGTLRGGHATSLSATGIVRLGRGDVNGPAALPRVEAPCRVGQPSPPSACLLPDLDSPAGIGRAWMGDRLTGEVHCEGTQLS